MAPTSRHFQPGSRDNAVRREFGWGERIVALVCRRTRARERHRSARRRGSTPFWPTGHPAGVRRRRPGTASMGRASASAWADEYRVSRTAAKSAHARIRQRLRHRFGGAPGQSDLSHGLPEQGVRLHGVRAANYSGHRRRRTNAGLRGGAGRNVCPSRGWWSPRGSDRTAGRRPPAQRTSRSEWARMGTRACKPRGPCSQVRRRHAIACPDAAADIFCKDSRPRRSRHPFKRV